MPTADFPVALRLTGVVKRYAARLAVDHLDLELGRGQVLGLLGPNGAGKSTLISIICGLTRADAGHIELGEHANASSPSARRSLGLAPQELAIYPELTALENLAFVAGMYGLKGREAEACCHEALEFVGLESRARERCRSFSGGMQRRLNLACALVHKPDLLLLDEATVGVDPQSRNLILERVAELRDRGHAVLYASHHMDEVARLSDRIAILDRGRVLDQGSLSELIARHAPERELSVVRDGQRIVKYSQDPLAELQSLAHDGTVTEFSARPASLEQVFLKLTGRALRD